MRASFLTEKRLSPSTKVQTSSTVHCATCPDVCIDNAGRCSLATCALKQLKRGAELLAKCLVAAQQIRNSYVMLRGREDFFPSFLPPPLPSFFSLREERGSESSAAHPAPGRQLAKYYMGCGATRKVGDCRRRRRHAPPLSRTTASGADFISTQPYTRSRSSRTPSLSTTLIWNTGGAATNLFAGRVGG